jgi:DNA-binding NtrC family response regulator
MRHDATAGRRESPPPRIVLVAPDPATQRRVQMALGEHAFLVAAAPDPSTALRLIEMESPAALVVDTRRASERAFARDAAQRHTPPLVGLIDANDGDAARQLLAAGIHELVPIALIESMLVHRLRGVLSVTLTTKPGAEGATARPRPWGRRRSDLLVGRSPEMVLLAERIDMIAKSDMGAAIYGETGTGKELVARTIHGRSRRAHKPFVVANCTALPEALFENELFGHERGAFTGADSRHLGLLSEAESGTLLLDEIGEISDAVQAKLLRLLQFREYKRIGDTKTLHADVRILTTTHRDLETAAAEGRFRQDLFYRMNTLHIRLPPLRARLEDVPLLVDHFVSLFNEREGRDCEGFAPSAIRLLQRHSWPGNVRELESVVYRSLVMAGGKRKLDDDDVDVHTERRASQPSQLDMTRPYAELKAEVLERFERSYLEAMMRRTRGNLSHAAREANHERKSLWRLLHKYGIDPRRYRAKSSSSG